MLEHAAVVIETEQERAHRILAALVPAKSRHDAVGRACMLDLDHCALAWQVSARLQLCNHAIEAGTFEARQPVHRNGAIACGGCDVHRWLDPGEQFFERSTAL